MSACISARHRWWGIGLAGLLTLAGCGRQAGTGLETATTQPVLAATIFPIGDMVRALAGSDADVHVILPAGASPALFEPTPDMVHRLTGARIVIAVGGGADDWAGALARAWGASLVTLTHRLDLGVGNNPHVWLDPILVRDVLLPVLAKAVIDVIPASEAAVRDRAADYATMLTDLDREIRTRLAGVRSRAFVAAHPAWPYFAARYDLRQVGVLYPTPGGELGPRDMAALVDEARRAGVRAVFTEPQLGESAVRAIADELGARIGMLDPLGGPTVAGRDSYPALLRFNAHELANALGGGDD